MRRKKGILAFAGLLAALSMCQVSEAGWRWRGRGGWVNQGGTTTYGSGYNGYAARGVPANGGWPDWGSYLNGTGPMPRGQMGPPFGGMPGYQGMIPNDTGWGSTYHGRR